ncbi:alpha-L-rhamnosidase-related protein [Flavitalea antarctica]
MYKHLSALTVNLFFILYFLSTFTGVTAQQSNAGSIAPVFRNTEQIGGNRQYLQSPFNTAGDRLYIVGYQDGSFPPIGWHVTGEMGGVWSHPVKLLDGFEVTLVGSSQPLPLLADSFINYPFGNKHLYNKISDEISIERYQFVPDGKSGFYVEYIFKNNSRRQIDLNFQFKAITNLRPVWLGERTGMKDGKDQSTYDDQTNSWITKDGLNKWFLAYSSPVKGIPQVSTNPDPAKPNVSYTATTYSFRIAAGESFVFPVTFAASMQSKSKAISLMKEIARQPAKLLLDKKTRVLALDSKSKITLSDKNLEKAFRWIKYNNDWLIIDVPGIGRSVSAGLPDYPWWFGGDLAYTLKGLIATGRKDLVYSSIDLIHRISEKTNGNGRIVHEVSTNGAVYNEGNVNETAQFASLVWEVFCWTGDLAFLSKHFPAIQKGLKWLMTENDKNRNLFPDGFGMMEIHGMNSEMVDVAAYTQRAFADAAQMARILGKTPLSIEYQATADAVREKINKDFWVEDFGSYADFIGTKAQALQLADDAIVRADTLQKPWAVAELKATRQTVASYPSNTRKGFVMHHNWVVNTPMEMGIADTAKAIIALETAKKFTSPFGMFVTGIDRDESAGSDTGSFAALANKRAFTYTGAVMTLPTGVQIVSENNYGRPDEAYALMQKMLRSFSYALPGSIYEVSPDFGMMTQAWNLYAFGEPIIKQFFGIRPMAIKKEINLFPLIPLALTEGRIDNVEAGNNRISVTFKREQDGINFQITQTQEEWTIIFSQAKDKFSKWMVDGKTIKPESYGNADRIVLKGKNFQLELKP